MGFPTSSEFAEMMGVTPEDQQRWEQQRAANKAAKAERGIGRGILGQSVAQGVGMMRRAVDAQLHGRAMGEEVRKPTRRVRHTVEEVRVEEIDENEGPDESYDFF